MINWTIEELEPEKHILLKRIVNKYDLYIAKRLENIINTQNLFYKYKESYCKLFNFSDKAADYKALIKCNENLIKSILKN